MNTYNSYSANSVGLSGATNLKNNSMVDGSLNVDAVMEVSIDKNSVDVSSGYRADGSISLVTKSGTNEVHGSVFWLGCNPGSNTVTDRTAGTKSAARNNIYDASAGGPIIRNKPFNFGLNFSNPVLTITNDGNLSDRVDWYANENWRIFARPTLLPTHIVQPSPLDETSRLCSGGSTRNAFSLAAAPQDLFLGPFRTVCSHRNRLPRCDALEVNSLGFGRYMKLCRYISGVLACALYLLAQSDRGTLTGTVQDPGSAMIPNAMVVAKNTETGSVFQTASTSTGNFTITALPAGVYDLTVEAPGFRRYIGKGTQVQVAQTVRLDVVLEVGAVSESVTVQAEAVLLKTDSAEQSVNVTGDKINNLPLNFGGGGGNIGGMRTPLTFMVLSPGVSGVSGTGGTGTAARVNGLPGNSFRVFVDGQDTTNNNDTASTAGQPSVEMIEEFSLQTSNFSAEFGQVAGGMFTFATRSGTNQLHGSLYEYFNNEALDAGKPYVHEKPQSRKHDFGGSLSGPIWIPKVYDGRNRTFFFLNYEAFRNDISAAGARNTVPTAAYRNGDFSGALTGRVLGADPLGRPIMENAIYDPATTRTVNGQVIRDPFPNNVIPSNRFDPVAVRIQSLFPQADFAGNINNWIQNPTSNKVSATPAMKLDHSFTEASKLSFYTTKSWNHTMQNGLDALPVPLTAFRDQRTYSYTTRVNYDHSITPTLLLHVGGGFLRFLNPDSSPNSVLEYDAEGLLGFRGAATGGGGVGGGFPRITGLSNSQGGMLTGNQGVGPTNANYYWVGKLTVPVSLTYVRNNHTWKIGAEYRLESYTDRNTRGASGVLAFSSEQTALPYLQSSNLGGGNIGFPYASFLLGLANSASVNAPQDPQWRNDRYGLFLQDTWKVTRKLTLDLGLRWDLMDQGHEIHYRNSMFGPTIPNPSAGGLPGGMVYEGYGPGRCDCNFIERYPYAIGPRLGFAYQITPKTVLRGGWGVVYGNTPTYQYFTNSAILGVGFDQAQWAAPGFATQRSF